MYKNNKVMRVLVAMVIALATLTTARANNNTSTISDGDQFKGVYHEVNTDLKCEYLTFIFEDDEFILSMGGPYDVFYTYNGRGENVKRNADSISFDCMMIPNAGFTYMPRIPAHISLTHTPNDIYNLDITFKEHSDGAEPLIEGTTPLFKLEKDAIYGNVPAKIGNNVTIAGLIKTVAPYVFTPEILSTVMYLRGQYDLADTEAVRQDEHNRYLEYAWGALGQCLECKYWHTDDGKVLLVINIHDATYENPQCLRFILFDREKGTLQELPTALSQKWPLEGHSSDNGIVYQVRYYSDGIVALVPQTDGDSLDVVTLKFDGKIFK